MKKILAFLLAGALAFSLAACGQEKEEDVVVGGWSKASSPVVTDEIKALVEKAVGETGGAAYTPVAYLGSQVVAGTNHRVLCAFQSVDPDSPATYEILTIYEDLKGNVEITEMLDSPAEAVFSEAAGGWSAPPTPAVTDEAKAALEKATEGMTGADYTPLALLGTQVVSGTNYALLCEVTAVAPDARPSDVIVHVYEDLDGNAEITELYEFFEAKG